MLPLLICLWAWSLYGAFATSYEPYEDIFFDPSLVIGKTFDDSKKGARDSVLEWAGALAAQGPWSVIDSTFRPEGANDHDYVSFSPYWWPDCSKVGNKTELKPEDVWLKCPYHPIDGSMNPDRQAVNNSGDFWTLSDAVLYNSLAYVLTSNTTYSDYSAKFLKTWFIDDGTKMNPSLNYAQMKRGPKDGQKGSRTGVLDLRGFTKITLGILLLRRSNSASWTSDLDTKMISWAEQYIEWLTTSDLGNEARDSENNHATFYFSQLAALQILVNDIEGAKESLEEYFDGVFKDQIDANGEQPLEASRDRAYHYRSFNALGAIINARLASYVNYTSSSTSQSLLFTFSSSSSGTIPKAFDYIVTTQTPPSDEYTRTTIAPALAMMLHEDSQNTNGTNGKRLDVLRSSMGGANYEDQPWFLWEGPFNGAKGLVPPMRSLAAIAIALMLTFCR